MKFLWQNKLFIVLIILLICFFPSAISLPQQNRQQNIITAIGIDKVGEEYEVSIQYVIPYGESSENSLKISSAKSSSVGEAIEKINLSYGKISGFAHCRAVVFNDEACKENFSNTLNYISRVKNNTNNIILINTKESAKKVLEQVKNLDSEFYVVLGTNSIASDQKHYQNLKTISDYFDSFLGKSKCINISNIDVREDSSSGGGSSSSSSSTGSESGASTSDSSSEPKINNSGKSIIIKNDNLLLTLDEEQSDNLNWFDKKVKDLTLKIQNFSDDIYSNANLILDVYDKKSNVEVYFKDNIPHYKLNVKANLTINQVLTDKIEEDVYEVSSRLFSEKLKQEIVKTIKENLTKAEENFKQNDYDVINCYEMFYKYKTKEFNDYLKSLSPDEYYIDGVVFEYNVDIKQTI